MDEIRFITKYSNASIIGISESKLDWSILNSELDIEEYDLIRLDHPKRGGGFHVMLKSSSLIFLIFKIIT